VTFTACDGPAAHRGQLGDDPVLEVEVRSAENGFNLPPHLISRPGLRTLQAKIHDAWVAATVAA
jgi:hypothetical protein